jgi:isoleucyl-tRNA synthetase
MLSDELNIKEIVYLADFSSLSTEYLSFNFQIAGKSLKGDLSRVKALLDSLSESETASCVSAYRNGQSILVSGYEKPLAAELFTVSSKEKSNIAKSQNGMSVALNTEITDELKTEGIYREILRHCQILRKEAGFAVSDRVLLNFETAAPSLSAAINRYSAGIMHETLSEIQCIRSPLIKKEIKLDEGSLTIKIMRT